MVLLSLVLPILMIWIIVTPYQIDGEKCTSLARGSHLILSDPPTASELAGADGSNLCEWGVQRWLKVMACGTIWMTVLIGSLLRSEKLRAALLGALIPKSSQSLG